jgi:tRNA G18 (ribose-2'-O)-methylase SpoU
VGFFFPIIIQAKHEIKCIHGVATTLTVFCRSIVPEFIHQRHKQPSESSGASELVLACPPLRSNVNLSRIVRAAGCCGVRRMVVCGKPKIDSKIARDALDQIEIENHRSLLPTLKKLQEDGFELVGLEQTTNSVSLYEFGFKERTALVIGHERLGITEDVLQILDRVVEIPVFGQPLSYNVATATAMTLYEYCRQRSE